MKFSEKLRLRVEQLGKTKAQLARKEGLDDTTISGYLARPDSIPRADIALKISRALEVPLEWLVDDSANWPPPEKSLRNVDDRALMMELCARRRDIFLKLVTALDLAESQDWQRVCEALEGWEPGKFMPPELRPLADAVSKIDEIEYLARDFDPDSMTPLFHPVLPGGDRKLSDFSPETTAARKRALNKKPGFISAKKKFDAWQTWHRDQIGLELSRRASAKAES